MKKTVFLFLLLCLVFSAFAAAPAAEIFRIDETLLKEAAKVTVAQFPDADCVLLREKESYTYEKSGAYKVSDELYIKILTEKGRQALRTLNFHFNVHYNSVAVEKLLVIKADGKAEEIDVAKNGRVATESSQMASNIYDPANRQLSVSVPRLEVGDILYLKSFQNYFKPRIPNFWSNYSLLQSDHPILENTIEVNAPAELPLRSIALKDEVKGTVTFSQKQEAGRIIYKWSARNVPQVIPEPGMPEFYTCVQRLLVSTASSWEEVSRWYWQLCRPRLDAVTPAMKKQVEELIKNKKTDMEKIREIFQFVSQNIRYMGITPEKEAPGYEPHDVKLTFEQRYGVCRDKAALLVSMLEMAGFKAYPVLFMSGDPKDDEIPNGYFNHAVTAVELGKGNYVLMDPTFESTTELFPSFQADMSYLVAHPQGEKLRRSPVVPGVKNRTEIRTNAQFDAENRLRGESCVKLHGVNDVYYRGALSQWTTETRKRFFTGRLQKVLPGAVLEELKITPENIRDMSRNIEFSFRFSAPAGTEGDLQLLPVPEFAGIFGVGEAVFQDVSLLTRKYPLKLASTCAVDEVCRVQLPAAGKLAALPEPEKYDIGGKITFSRTARRNGRELQLQCNMEVNTLELTAKEYPQLKKLLTLVQNSSKTIPIAVKDYRIGSVAGMLKAFPGANSVIEKLDVTVDVRDPANWSVRSVSRRKILNYAGVKEHSEFKLSFVPGWLEPGKVEGSVIAPDGKVQKIAPVEINVMDSPRNAAAPRYPAEKIMVISLPRVVPGSTVVLDVTRNFLNRPFFSEQHCFVSRSAPVVSGSLTVSAPDNMYIKGNVSGEAPCQYEEWSEKGKRLKQWRFSNLPRMYEEGGQPVWQLFCPGVMVSSESNKTYAQMLNKLLWDKVNNSLPAAEKLIEEQNWRQIKKKEELLVRIRDYVDKFIRKTSVPLSSIPLTALSDAGVTLSSGYGNSADLAILLGAILKALKIEFHFTGVSDVGRSQQVSRLFNHNPDPERMTGEILLYLPDLQWYLNDTGRYAAPGSVRNDGKLGMDLSSGRLIMVQSLTMKNSDRQLAFHVDCKADDSADIRVTETLYGTEYEDAKEFLENATPERRRRFFEERASAVSHTSKLADSPSFNFKEYPGTLSYRIHAADYLSRSGSYRIVPLPRYELLQRVSALPAADKRRTPYWRNTAARLGLRYTIIPPPGYSAVPGRKEKVQEGKYGSAQFTETFSANSGQITLHSRLFLPVELVSTLDFCELENSRMRFSRAEADRIILEQTPKKSRMTYDR